MLFRPFSSALNVGDRRRGRFALHRFGKEPHASFASHRSASRPWLVFDRRASFSSPLFVRRGDLVSRDVVLLLSWISRAACRFRRLARLKYLFELQIEGMEEECGSQFFAREGEGDREVRVPVYVVVVMDDSITRGARNSI